MFDYLEMILDSVSLRSTYGMILYIEPMYINICICLFQPHRDSTAHNVLTPDAWRSPAFAASAAASATPAATSGHRRRRRHYDCCCRHSCRQYCRHRHRCRSSDGRPAAGASSTQSAYDVRRTTAASVAPVGRPSSMRLLLLFELLEKFQ